MEAVNSCETSVNWFLTERIYRKIVMFIGLKKTLKALVRAQVRACSRYVGKSGTGVFSLSTSVSPANSPFVS
jgi:hypothetical protein